MVFQYNPALPGSFTRHYFVGQVEQTQPRSCVDVVTCLSIDFGRAAGAFDHDLVGLYQQTIHRLAYYKPEPSFAFYAR
jgi:hypothetical protein